MPIPVSIEISNVSPIPVTLTVAERGPAGPPAVSSDVGNIATLGSDGLVSVNFTNLPIYADNTAAISDGLVVGNVYRTNLGNLMVVFDEILT